MATMIARAIRIIQGTNSNNSTVSYDKVLSRFKDSGSIPSWAAQDVAWLVEYNLLKGNPQGGFNPDGSTTRAEAAVLIIRVLKELNLMD
ncbi:Cellulosome-anchoring protein precursor [compost metagenome]